MASTQDLTPKQGQYLAFIYYYTKINRRAPAETDFQRYFRVSPLSVHNMIVTPTNVDLFRVNVDARVRSSC